MVLAWIAGFVVYHWLVAPGTMPGWWTRLVTSILPAAGKHTGWGASLPCFTVTFIVALVVTAITQSRTRATVAQGP